MGILTTDVIVMSQVTSFLSNDFGIHDLGGQPIGRIVTEGSTGSRLFLGTRQLAIVDADGSLLLRVDDVVNLGRDRFEVHDGHGRQVATLVKEFTFFTKSLRVELTTGAVLQATGSMFDREFAVDGPGGRAATVSRNWPGAAEFLLGRERYVVACAPQLPVPEKLGTIGAVIALDLIRAKERRSN